MYLHPMTGTATQTQMVATGRQVLRSKAVYLHPVTGTATQTQMVATGRLDSSADHL